MDLFNQMAQLEVQHNIPRGTLRFKEGEECQGVGCGYVNIVPTQCFDHGFSIILGTTEVFH